MVKKYHRSFVFVVYYTYHINKAYHLIKKVTTTDDLHIIIKVLY